MERLSDFVGTANGIIWSTPMLILCLCAGAIFTVVMGAPQIRHIPNMVKLLFNGKASEEGLSSFQAFALAIAGRVGVGNIAGVATAVCMGGPGAIFWMWVIAIVGSATSFVECSLSQLHKRTINGEYRGGWMYYIGDHYKALGAFAAVLFSVTMPFTQSSLHTNAISSAVHSAFGVPKIAVGITVAIILALIVFGGAKRIGRVAELVVPFMSAGYILVSLIIILAHASEIPEGFRAIFVGAFGQDQVIGAAMGSAMIWGTKRAIFSSETGLTTATASAASANVSHPAKQGLVQAFSIYIDTLFVCTATGLMLVVSGCYNVQDESGKLIFMGLGKAMEAGPIWVQKAMETVVPWGGPFIAIAIFFFGFTSIMNHNYSTISGVGYFFQKKGTPKWFENAINLCFVGGVIFGSTTSAEFAWDLGDTFLGTCVWINYIFLLMSTGVAIKLLRDFEQQQKSGIDPVFEPEKFEGNRGFNFDMSLWKVIRDRFKSGELKN